MALKTKKSKKSKEKTLSKAERIARKKERLAKKKAKKGDGSFPDIIVITKEERKDGGEPYFAAHDGSTLDTLYDDGTEVGVYKLRRVSTVVVSRKIAR